MDVHRGVGPLGWRGAGRGAEEAAEAASGDTGSEGWPRGSLLCPLPTLAPQLTTARWWISSSPGQTDALGTLYRGRGRGARDPLSPCPGRPVPRLHPPTGPCPGQPGISLARDRVLGSPPLAHGELASGRRDSQGVSHSFLEGSQHTRPQDASWALAQPGPLPAQSPALAPTRPPSGPSAGEGGGEGSTTFCFSGLATGSTARGRAPQGAEGPT